MSEQQESQGARTEALISELHDLLDVSEKHRRFNKIDRYRPYKKQRRFHNSKVRETLFGAGNQLGKTEAGAFQAAFHATGLYPEWYEGKRFDRPTIGVILAGTGKQLRDGAQKKFIGPPSNIGSGSIPLDTIEKTFSAARPTGLLDFCTIKHTSGGISEVYFRTYAEGVDALAGMTVDWVWCDEEAPEDVYLEILTRTNATLGPVWTTFTPLKGMSRVVYRFLGDDKGEGAADRVSIRMGIDEVVAEGGHITAEMRDRIVASYPPHEKDARTKGVPSLGEGAVYPIEEHRITADIINLHPAWRRIAGIDFGFTDPTAVVWLAHDTETDIVYLYDCYMVDKELPVVHASAIKARGQWIPVAWPFDGSKTDPGSGKQVMKQYKKEGVRMLYDYAKHDPTEVGAGKSIRSVEVGINNIFDRMRTGRFKVAAHLTDWFDEFRLYHRKKGKIVDLRDHLMDATRYAVMMLQHARTKPASSSTSSGGKLKYKNLGIV